MERLLRKLEKPVADAFLAAIRDARSFAEIRALMAALETGDSALIMRAAGIRDGMFSPMTENIRSAYMEGGVTILQSDLPKRIAMTFDINNPRAQDWLRKQSSQLITRVMADQISAVQVIMEAGMIRGDNPRTVALDIVGRIGPSGRRSGGVLGLNQQQAQWVVNMSDDLDNLDMRYFDRKLRDRRFDSVVRRHIEAGKPIPIETKQKVVARYEDRMLKLRGDTIGRTETLRAVNEASDEAMRQVVDEGLAPKNSVVRIWRHSFSANEREGHVMMNGQRRGIDEAFTNPITGAVLSHPGEGPADETINCRCYIEHAIDFAAVERAA
jgi:hypothetical protein